MKDRKKILIVDDEKEFLALIREALEMRGFEVITACNAVESGLELATRLPSLILMDIKMPGIDGMQACKAIKRNPVTKNIPIVIVSGLVENSYAKKAKKLGITECLTKPVDIEKLINKIQEILN